MANSEAFSIKPKSIEKATLIPTDKTIFSVSPSLFILRASRKRKPGIKVKKIKPKICLKSGMFKRMLMLVRTIMIIIRPNHLIGDKFIPRSVIFAHLRLASMLRYLSTAASWVYSFSTSCRAALAISLRLG